MCSIKWLSWIALKLLAFRQWLCYMTPSRNIHALFHGHTISTGTRQQRSSINNAAMPSGGSRGVTHSLAQTFLEREWWWWWWWWWWRWRRRRRRRWWRREKILGNQPARLEDAVQWRDLPNNLTFLNSYPANVDNMASSYECQQMADGI